MDIIQPPITDIIRGTLLTTQGDLIKRGAAVNERFGIGLSRQICRTNIAANDLEYVYEGSNLKDNILNFIGPAATIDRVGAGTDNIINTGNIAVKNGDIYLITSQTMIERNGVDVIGYLELAETSALNVLFNNVKPEVREEYVLYLNLQYIEKPIVSLIYVKQDGNMIIHLDNNQTSGTSKIFINASAITIIPLYKQN
jgi:hypothetical protein